MSDEKQKKKTKKPKKTPMERVQNTMRVMQENIQKDTIEIEVGNQKFKSTRETLEKSELLKDALDLQKKGQRSPNQIFVDEDPTYFPFLLWFLRQKEIDSFTLLSKLEKIEYSEIQLILSSAKNFRIYSLVDLLENYLGTTFDPNLIKYQFEISENATRFKRINHDSVWKTAFSRFFRSGKHYFEGQLISASNNRYVMFGVTPKRISRGYSGQNLNPKGVSLHFSDGKLYIDSKSDIQLAPQQLEITDFLGVFLDMESQPKTVTFCVNGEVVGSSPITLSEPKYAFCVSTYNVNDEIKIFPFATPPESLLQKEKENQKN
ncbi:potassium channel tetramerization domain-containing [Anaeramoeba ignava]|uniref:Potassium channel tetramerization domain-containing n=1 Tax=Anaeramoeba ignava TaxID=1746090 RepID=A0A9Q0RDZ0_ANAIG|nr:potassium channel tetramerization domain-containing [Anaeramoeba ignava]